MQKFNLLLFFFTELVTNSIILIEKHLQEQHPPLPGHPVAYRRYYVFIFPLSMLSFLMQKINLLLFPLTELVTNSMILIEKHL